VHLRPLTYRYEHAEIAAAGCPTSEISICAACRPNLSAGLLWYQEVDCIGPAQSPDDQMLHELFDVVGPADEVPLG
jgi:hypothetical protein